MKQPIRVGVTGGAGQICYNLLYRIAAGEVFGMDQPVVLHILEIPQAIGALHGVVMELDDCAFPLLQGVVAGDDPYKILEAVDFAILVGARPRSKGMERADLLQQNAQIFVHQGKAINKKAKVLVVGNPANTNALVLLHNAKEMPHENIRSMMRLDQNRAITQLAKRAGVMVNAVKEVAVYGNHSPTMVPDYCNAKINGRPALEVIHDKTWLQGEFMTTVQQRGSAIIAARGFSSAASAAHAIICSIQDWIRPTPKDDWYAAGVYAHNNPYRIEGDLFFSFPLREGKIVGGLKIDAFLEEKVKASEKELMGEREMIRSCL